MLNHTSGSAPEHVHGARSPSLQTLVLFVFRECSWFPSVLPCPAPGAGLCLWLGFNPPGVRLCAHLLPLLWGGAFPRPRPRARRGLTLPRAYVVEGLRASRDRVQTAGETTARNAQGGLRPKGRRTARGLWLSEPVAFGGGESLHRAPALRAEPFTWLSTLFLVAGEVLHSAHASGLGPSRGTGPSRGFPRAPDRTGPRPDEPPPAPQNPHRWPMPPGGRRCRRAGPRSKRCPNVHGPGR